MSVPRLVSRNGEFLSPEQATISVFSPALSAAHGAYETLQVANGVVFARQAHLARLAHSAEMLDLPLPAGLDVFNEWIDDILAANQVAACTLRILLVGAINGGGTTAFLWPQPSPIYSAEFYRAGASAITFAGERALPTAKSLNTLVNALARRRAEALGAHEALLYHAGCLTEGSSSNLFAVIDGVVLTPPAEQVLSGVTRDLVLKLARENGLPVRETPLALADLPLWDECFITSTSRHVMPISSIDGQAVGRPVGGGLAGGGRVGPLTQRLADLYEQTFRRATQHS